MGKILKNGTEYGLGGKALIDRIYPVGSIYISTSSTFNPQTAWGGTWRKTASGRCLIGANDTYPLGTMGGEANHTLTVNEIPSHDHGLSHFRGSKNIQHGGDFTSLITNGNKSYSTVETGGGQAHNNMQPYLAVYIWERTA